MERVGTSKFSINLLFIIHKLQNGPYQAILTLNTECKRSYIGNTRQQGIAVNGDGVIAQ
jgi:hypothetical protein